MAVSERAVRMCFWAPLLLILSTGCRPNHSITLESTIEEPVRPAAVVDTFDPKIAPQLIRGFYSVEEDSWRWTMSKFAVSVGTPSGADRDGAWVVLKFQLPEVLLRHFKSVTVSAALDHTRLPPETYDQAGTHEYRCQAPASLLKNDAVLLEFSLDNYLPAGAIESRELGLIVSSIALEPK